MNRWKLQRTELQPANMRGVFTAVYVYMLFAGSTYQVAELRNWGHTIVRVLSVFALRQLFFVVIKCCLKLSICGNLKYLHLKLIV